MLRAAINIHQQRRAVGRNTKSIAAVHACVSQDLRKLPFLQNLSVEIDLVNVVQIVTKIDLPSRAHSGAPNASGFSSAFFTKRNAEPSALTTPSCHALSAMIENASCFPSGDHTGPKQLSLGIFG